MDSGDICDRFEQWEEWDASTPLWKHAAAGSCAGVMEHIGMYPLDTVKTHMQALRPGGARTLSSVIQTIVAESGGRGFMRGASSIVIGCVPAHIALFTSYEYVKGRLLTDDDGHAPARAALCGATATLCHDAILTPMDVVKQRMQLGVYRNAGDCLRSVIWREGLWGLYRSMPTTLAMNVPFGSILVASNESTKQFMGIRQLGRRRPDDSRSLLPWYFLAAGLSGAVASALTQPLDVVKTRLQTQDCLVTDPAATSRPSVEAACARQTAAASSAAGGLAEAYRQPKYAGFLEAVRTIVREEGWLAFYTGVMPRMLHAVPSAAMCWGTYEVVKSLLAEY